MALNANEGEHEFIQADCLEWLATEAQLANRHYDLIFLDPPTFSNSKRMDEVFDIQTDHVQLINNAVSCCRPEVSYTSPPTSGDLKSTSKHYPI